MINRTFRFQGHVGLDAHDGIYVGGIASCYFQIKNCIHQCLLLDVHYSFPQPIASNQRDWLRGSI